MASRAAVDLQLLGRFECRVDGRRVPVAPRGRRLLALIALQGPRGLSRTAAGQVLWPDLPRNRQKANVRGVLHRLPPLVTEHMQVDDTISLDECWNVDHAYVVRLASGTGEVPATDEAADAGDAADTHDADGAGDEAGAEERLTPEQLAHPLLPEWDEPCLENPRQRFEDLRVRAMEDLARRHRALGRGGAALTAAEMALATRPTRQTAATLVVELHLDQGNVDDALSVTSRFTETLQHDLGAAPTDDFLALTAELREGRDATATR